MTPDEILEIDAKRNHPEGTEAGHLRAAINQDIRQGGQVLRQGNTLIAFRPTAKGVVEYHCFNADTPEALAANVCMFWDMLRKAGTRKAVTRYRNEKISALLRGVMKRYTVDIARKGDVFEATTDLKRS
jgi:hypothetical protein